MQNRKLMPLFYSDAANDKYYDELEFDRVSEDLIDKSSDNDRHAFVGLIPIVSDNETSPPPRLIARSRPGLRSDATLTDIQRAEQKFGADMFVVASDQGSNAGTGIVHIKTIEQVEKLEPNLKNEHNQKYRYIGMSFTVEVNDDNEKKLSWINRSAQNLRLFKRDELALACLTFAPDTRIGSHIKYTLAYDLNRSVPKEIVEKILKSAEKKLNIKNHYSPERCYSIKWEEYWNNIRSMEDKAEQTKNIKELLMTNIYICSALPPDSDKVAKDLSKNGYELALINIFKTAKKYEISIDPDFVPERFKGETENASALIMAAKGGYTRIVELLIENGASLEKEDNLGNTALLWAARNGHDKIVNLLIEKGALINCKNKAGEGLAQLAEEHGHIRVLSVLAKHGIDVNWEKENQEGNNPVHIAAMSGYDDVLKLLQDSHVDLEKENKEGFSPAHLATKYGHVNVLHFLSENHINLDKKNKEGNTPAHVAAMSGRMDALHFLSESGINLDEDNKEGYTPAMLAAKYAKVNVLRFLNENHIKLDKENKEGNSAAHLAAMFNNVDVLRFLSESGIDLDKENKEGFTPAHLAAMSGNVKVLKFLVLECQIQLDKENKDGFTMAHLAAMSGQTRVLEFLSNNYINLDKENNAGFTPAHLAAEHGHESVLNFLSDNDYANLNKKNKEGDTPTHLAAKHGKTRALNALVTKRKVELDLTNEEGFTAIHLAAKHGQKSALDVLLIKKGELLNVEDKNGNTPVHLAAMFNQDVILDLLFSAKIPVAAWDKENKEGDTPAHLAAGQDHVKALYVMAKNGIDLFKENSRGVSPADVAAQYDSNAANVFLRFYPRINEVITINEQNAGTGLFSPNTTSQENIKALEATKQYIAGFITQDDFQKVVNNLSDKNAFSKSETRKIIDDVIEKMKQPAALVKIHYKL